MPEDLLDYFTEKARSLVDEAVAKTEQKFPDEGFPVRPPYRRAVYRRYRKLQQAMCGAWETLTAGSPGAAEDPALLHGFGRLQKQYLREYGLRTQKKEEKVDAG